MNIAMRGNFDIPPCAMAYEELLDLFASHDAVPGAHTLRGDAFPLHYLPWMRLMAEMDDLQEKLTERPQGRVTRNRHSYTRTISMTDEQREVLQRTLLVVTD